MTSTGTQITDMTAEGEIPAGGYVPFVVEEETGGLSPLDNYRYNLGADLLTRITYSRLAQDTGAELVGYLLSGTGAIARTLEQRLDEHVPFENFLATDYNPASDDCSTAIATAATWSAANNRVVVFAGEYLIANCATVTTSGTRFHFDNPVFNVMDDGTPGTLTTGTTGQIGILFREADNIQLSGSGRFVGQGNPDPFPGGTPLAGMVFDHCDNAIVTATFRYENMAAGRFVMWCDFGLFGDISAYRMAGRQTFDVGAAGTAEVVLGCNSSAFGEISSELNFKPIRYLSVTPDADSARIDNEACTFGMVTGTPWPDQASPINSQNVLFAIRSGKNCVFEGATGDGFSSGLVIIRYNTDADYTVDGNIIKSISGNFAATSASVDSAVSQGTEDPAFPIGVNIVQSVNVTLAAGAERGVSCEAGTLIIDSLQVTGSKRPVVGYDCTLTIGTAIVRGAAEVSVVIGQSCIFSADKIIVLSGPTNMLGPPGAVAYDTAFGTGGFGSVNIGSIYYRRNASAGDYQYVFANPIYGTADTIIGNIDGTGSSGEAFFGADEYSIRNSRYLTTVPPTVGAALVGDVVWNSAPAVGDPTGWVCTVAGTPGTWEPLAIVGDFPVAAAVADPTGGATVDAEARTAIIAIIDSLQAAGLMAP